jgi:hypothetical protein
VSIELGYFSDGHASIDTRTYSTIFNYIDKYDCDSHIIHIYTQARLDRSKIKAISEVRIDRVLTANNNTIKDHMKLKRHQWGGGHILNGKRQVST